MRQFQFGYRGRDQFLQELRKIRQWSKTKILSRMVFQVFTETPDRDEVEGILKLIEQELPEALVFGCSTNGHIINGNLSQRMIAVTCTVFEYPTSRVQIRQYDLNQENEAEVTSSILKVLEENPWVSAIELLVTIRGMSMTGFSDQLREARRDIAIFGGGAFNADMNEDTACVFSNVAGSMSRFLMSGSRSSRSMICLND